MAKSQTNQATGMANQLSSTAKAEEQSSIFGGPQSAFGPSGLTGGFQQAAKQAQQSRGAAFTGAQNMALTGGFTPADKATYLREATSGVADSYKTLMQQAKQREAATGGVGGPSAISQMARQGGELQARTTTKALADMHQQITSNILAGDEMLAQLYNADNGQLTAYGQQILTAMGINTQNQAEALNALTNLSRNPGAFQTAIGDIAALAGSTKYV